jgi:plastocyanin
VRALLALLLLPLVASLAQGQDAARINAVDDGSGGGPGYHYDPLRLAVAPGATVTVHDAGQEPHTLSAVDKSFDVSLAPGGDATFTAPTAPGEYKFYCKYHAGPATEPGQGMAGVLVVQAANATSSTPAAKSPGFGPAALVVALGAAVLLLGRRR